MGRDFWPTLYTICSRTGVAPKFLNLALLAIFLILLPVKAALLATVLLPAKIPVELSKKGERSTSWLFLVTSFFINTCVVKWG